VVYENKVTLHFITPGRPMENGYIESFHGKFREECLNERWFLTLDDARETIEDCRIDYNQVRPHSSLGDLTPKEFATGYANVEIKKRFPHSCHRRARRQCFFHNPSLFGDAQPLSQRRNRDLFVSGIDRSLLGNVHLPSK
jgi:hypothetical protein